MAYVKSKKELDLMTEAGRRLGFILKRVLEHVHVGVRTDELDRIARELILAGGDEPSFLGYTPGGTEKPYPATTCVSVNDCVVHGQPSPYVLREGDVASVDIGLKHKNYHADMAVTVGVGEISAEAQRLIDVARRSLDLGVAAAKPGNTLGDIGYAVQSYVESHGFSVVRALTGHGIGRELHEDPHVYNFGKPGQGEELLPGMVIAIEPMITAGGYQVKQMKDDSFVTKDGSLAAHFEHTVAITEYGPKILTVI